MAISPWEGGIFLKSPDHKKFAIIEFASEIAMGAPTSGTLRTSNNIIFKNCNPSMIWSEDSKYLAIPKWTYDRNQKLIIIDIQKKQLFSHPETFSVLELHSFSKNIIKAINSPLTSKKNIEIDVREIVSDYSR